MKSTEPILQLASCSLYRMGDTAVLSNVKSIEGGDLELRLQTLHERELNAFLFAIFFAH